jgi:hypothetical protein
MTTHDEERQIDHHAYIAATVAVFVAGAELAITEWVSEAWHQSRLWTFVAGLGAILFLFFLVFRIIRWHERRWHRKEAKRRDEAEAKAIELATVGCVDGIWLDVIYDIHTKQRVEGSVIKIQSSGRGFAVEGFAFELADLEKDPTKAEHCGHFHGVSRHWDHTGFVYAYEGKKGARQMDKGAVVYEFTTLGANRLIMSGVFFGFGLKSAFFIQGKRIDSSVKNLSANLQKEKPLLRDFMLKEKPATLQ